MWWKPLPLFLSSSWRSHWIVQFLQECNLVFESLFSLQRPWGTSVLSFLASSSEKVIASLADSVGLNSSVKVEGGSISSLGLGVHLLKVEKLLCHVRLTHKIWGFNILVFSRVLTYTSIPSYWSHSSPSNALTLPAEDMMGCEFVTVIQPTLKRGLWFAFLQCELCDCWRDDSLPGNV